MRGGSDGGSCDTNEVPVGPVGSRNSEKGINRSISGTSTITTASRRARNFWSLVLYGGARRSRRALSFWGYSIKVVRRRSGARWCTRPLSNMAMAAVLKRVGRRDITVHGFRSTFRDWAAERTNYPSEVVEMALAHAVGNKVEAAYRRGDLFEKRRLLMADWATFCNTPQSVTRGTVIPMRKV